MKYYHYVFCLVVALILPTISNAQTINFVSDQSWDVVDTADNSLGTAQAVCLNALSPSPCPSGATQYGFSGSGWEADLTPILSAQWIWAPGITGSSSPAELEAYSFSKTFVLDANATEATIFIAADDFASVSVNGSLVGAVGSTTDASLAVFAANNLTSFDISSFLDTGNNVIEIMGQNGIGAFASCSNCTYSQHPAGVVFGGTITTVPIPATMWLFGTGLLGLLSFARRRKSSTLQHS